MNRLPLGLLAALLIVGCSPAGAPTRNASEGGFIVLGRDVKPASPPSACVQYQAFDLSNEICVPFEIPSPPSGEAALTAYRANFGEYIAARDAAYSNASETIAKSRAEWKATYDIVIEAARAKARANGRDVLNAEVDAAISFHKDTDVSNANYLASIERVRDTADTAAVSKLLRSHPEAAGQCWSGAVIGESLPESCRILPSRPLSKR